MDALNGMNAVVLVFAALCVFAIAYRCYGLFIANKVLRIDPTRPVPSVVMADGRDYHKTGKYVLFGHHFAAIAAAGPLTGPVLAAQFGFLPGALWILVGSVFAGAVHDTVVLFGSVRHQGKGLSRIAHDEVGKPAGVIASISYLFILILTLSGLSIAIVNALSRSPWGTFIVASTIPIAIIMGLIMKDRGIQGDAVATVVGVGLLFCSIVFGQGIVRMPAFNGMFNLSKDQLSLAIPIYAMIASVLPMWFLLVPRDYLSTYLKAGTIIILALGIIKVHPNLQMPAVTEFIAGGGPVVPGALFPFLFITIACGAISGYHALIASGTTPKMIGNERDIPFVGYGAMLFEGFVAMMALISACVLVPADYFAINAPAEVFAKLGMEPVNLPWLAEAVQENIQGRTGGSVSLAVGMAYVFSSMPHMKGMMAYWYHFAIMFEAVFILSAVDAGTRTGRLLLQSSIGSIIPKFRETGWKPGVLITGLLFSSCWGYLLYTGNIATIWPLFGMSNQLLAGSALVIMTTMLIRLKRARYIWVTAIPAAFMAVVTFYAGYLNIVDNYLPKKDWLLAGLSVVIMGLMAALLAATVIRWRQLLKAKTEVTDKWGEKVLAIADDENPKEKLGSGR